MVSYSVIIYYPVRHFSVSTFLVSNYQTNLLRNQTFLSQYFIGQQLSNMTFLSMQVYIFLSFYLPLIRFFQPSTHDPNGLMINENGLKNDIWGCCTTICHVVQEAKNLNKRYPNLLISSQFKDQQVRKDTSKFQLKRITFTLKLITFTLPTDHLKKTT